MCLVEEFLQTLLRWQCIWRRAKHEFLLLPCRRPNNNNQWKSVAAMLFPAQSVGYHTHRHGFGIFLYQSTREIFRIVFPLLVHADSNDFGVELKSIVSNFAKFLAWEFSASCSSLLEKFWNLAPPLWIIVKTPCYLSDSNTFPCLCDGGGVSMGPRES